MVLANGTSISGTDYVDVLSRAGLDEAFEDAWGCELHEHDRENAGLGEVSEDVIVEKTLVEDDDLWGFSMSYRQDRNPPTVRYTLTPVDAVDVPYEQSLFSVVEREQLEALGDAISTIRENRPEDPETVSYALDDIENILGELL